MTILVVDDEPLQRELITQQLHRHGFDQVIACESGTRALALLSSMPDAITLILCDLQMPGMDGVEFVRHLAQVGFQEGIVLVSGEDARTLHAAEKLARAYALNIHGMLQKPINPAELKSVLECIKECQGTVRRGVRKQYAAEALRQAIINQDLINVYQPKVAVETGELVGVEALVRWQHAIDGMIFPDRFITVAEEAGLIHDLTEVVLQQAAHDTREWLNGGLSLHIAVNISMDSLTVLDFPDQVMRAIAKAGIPPSALCLELTESKLQQETKMPLDILTRLRLKGVELSLDDFGTGHSSLVQLRNLPFDELKLDRSFVHGAVRNQSLAIMLQSNVEMASKLGLRTVAEGIEDVDDWHFLRHMPVDLVQGYFIAKPMLSSELPAWLSAWTQRLPDLLKPTSGVTVERR